MLRRFGACKKIISSNSRAFGMGWRREFSQTNDAAPSYIHRMGPEPLKFLTIGQLLKQSATKYPDRLALITTCENSQLTFAEVLDKADRLASGLLNLGLSRGDRVAIWAPNYQFWYVSMLAIARSGLICVALNPAYQLPEVDYSIKKVDVKAIIIPEEFRTQKYYEMLTSLVPSMKSQIEDNQANTLRHVIVVSDKTLPGTIKFDDLLIASPESDIAEIEKMQSSIQPDDGCNLQFTSGTTGHPKASLISHFSIVNNSFDTAQRLELHKEHRVVCSVMPFFHIAGIVSIVLTIINGSTIVVPSPHFNAELTLRAISKLRAQCVFASPNMYVDMVANQKKLQLDLPDIAYSCVGAAICTPKLVSDARKYLKIKNFQSKYGMTETAASGFQSLPGEDSDLVIDHVGQVADHLEAKIIDKDGKTVPFGQPGELCLRGYCNMLSYWNDPVKTAEVLGDDKWLKTGDQFILYTNGYAKIIGRLKEMIIRGGENLFPREIEDFLNTHPNILEAHVIGIPDERMGEEVGAFIRLKDPSKPVSAGEVKSFCKGKLAHFKIPRYIFVVDNFPRTTNGKVQKIKFLEFFADAIKKLH